MDSMLHIGADVSKIKAALPEMTKAILAILATTAGDEVKKHALASLSSAYKVENVSVMNCNFQNDK